MSYVLTSRRLLMRRRRLYYMASMSCRCVRFFFFFQAEDGIRDVAVTGVQTCALPIWPIACGACGPGIVRKRAVTNDRVDRKAALHRDDAGDPPAIQRVRSPALRRGESRDMVGEVAFEVARNIETAQPFV